MKRNASLVTVSTLALVAAYGSIANAQIQFNCLRGLDIGGHAACSNGSLVINPDGTTNLTGCLVTVNNPQEGQCTLSTGGVAPTRNVVVEFTRTSIFITAGGPQAQVNNFRMLHPGTTTPAPQFTFTPTELLGNTITLDFGGTLHFSDGQTTGNYSGAIALTADLQ